MSTQMIERAVVKKWLEAQANIYPDDFISTSQLFRMLIGNVEHLPKYDK